MDIKYLSLIGTIIATSSGHVLLKIGISNVKKIKFTALIVNELKPYLFLSAGFFLVVVGFIFWVICLKYFKVSYAYAMSSVSFLLVALAGNIFLDEQLLVYQWLGVGLIICGVIMLNIT